MSCLRPSRKKSSPPSTTKKAIWCRCHYCRRKINAGKSCGTIWILKFLNKIGFTRVMHGSYTQGEYIEEERNNRVKIDKRLASKASTSTMSFQHNRVDPIFDEFIEKNRERFKLEKYDSFERSNYYAMWPYITYFDPNV